MIIKQTSLCQCSYTFHIFPFQIRISEPTHFVRYSRNLYIRGPFIRGSTVYPADCYVINTLTYTDIPYIPEYITTLHNLM